AAASAAEMRPLVERIGRNRTVLAIDLPGFGASARDAIDYTPALMTDAVLRAADWLRDHGLRRPVDVVALSLSCEFVARAVLERPSWFRSIALVSPTGLESDRAEAY